MIRYIRCTLEGATDSQIEEVFCDTQNALDLEESGALTAEEMIAVIIEAVGDADMRQIEDVYWSVLYSCD